MGRFGWGVDPMFKSFPGTSSYSFANNSPLAMIDKDGKHAEIIINKISTGKGKPVTLNIQVNSVFITSMQQLNGHKFANKEDFINFDQQVKSNYSGTFVGISNGKSYNANFKVSFDNILQTDDQVNSELRIHKEYNSIKFNQSGKAPAYVQGQLTWVTNFADKKNNTISHEVSHSLGGAGDNHAPNPNWMSGYGDNRQVQNAEVNEIVDPAVKLADGESTDKVIIHMFADTDANGQYCKDMNTYKVYDQETKKYKSSITVPANNVPPSPPPPSH